MYEKNFIRHYWNKNIIIEKNFFLLYNVINNLYGG